MKTHDNHVLRANFKAQETINRAQTNNIVELESTITSQRDENRELRREVANFKADG